MPITTNIRNYAKPHNNGQGGGVTYVNGGSTNIGRNINVSNINASTGDITSLSGKTLNYDNGTFRHIGAQSGVIQNLSGFQADYTIGGFQSLTADNINGTQASFENLNVNDYAWIKELGSHKITTEYLDVTKQAHFYELVIDKIKSVGGQIILTPANSVLDYAKAVSDKTNAPINYTANNTYYLSDITDPAAEAYDVFWKAVDDNGRAINNEWQVDDQAICQSFNNVYPGVNYDVSNKYYWRLVLAKLGQRYMNFDTGEELPTNTPLNDLANTVTISAPALLSEVPGPQGAQGTVSTYNTGWNVTATVEGINTGATWTQTSGGAGAVTQGTMTTTNTLFGIALAPISGEDISVVVPTKFTVGCSKARLNITVYYTDETIQYFPAPATGVTSYSCGLNTKAEVKTIIITNADEPVWHLVEGIRLSNKNETNPVEIQFDESVSKGAAIPSAGDNIVQLGYRYNKYQETDPEYDVNRASAIIISAYHSPDTDVVPPSYAQYQKITSFSLNGTNRGTWMDATGCYIKGKLVTTSGNEIDITDQGLDVNSNVYSIRLSENPIVRPTSGTKNVQVTVLHLNNGTGTIMKGAQLSGWYIIVNNDTQNPISRTSGHNYFDLPITTSSTDVNIKLYDNNDILKDSYTATCLDLEDISDGINGSWTQWIFKNVAIGITPTIDVIWNGQVQIPTGWSATQPAPVEGYAIWYSTRLVTYNSSNVASYGNWATPDKSTGKDGTTGPQGPQGDNGPQGYNGVDGNYWTLIPLSETFAVTIGSELMGAQAYENIKGKLYVDLIYAVAHIDGDTITYMSTTDLMAYGINVISDNSIGNNNQTFSTANIVTVSVKGDNTRTYAAFRYNIDNYLTYAHGSGNNTDYYYLHKNGRTSYMPTQLTVTLQTDCVDGTWRTKLDTKVVNLAFKASHLFSVADTALTSVYQGLSGDQGAWSTTGWSRIKQTWDNINLSVSNIRRLENGEVLVNTDTEQFALFRKTNTTAPSAPTDDVGNSTEVNNAWTTYLSMAPNDTYKYEYITSRTRPYGISNGAQAYGIWSSWSTPKLYWTYGENRSTTINSAQLNIEADNITSTVQRNIRTSASNLVMNGAFKGDGTGTNNTKYWLTWDGYSGTPTTREITTVDGQNWMHIVSQAYKWQGYRQTYLNTESKMLVEPNTEYTLTLRGYYASMPSSNDAKVGCIIHWYDSNKNQLLSYNTNLECRLTTTADDYYWTVTSPANARYFVIHIGTMTNHVQNFYISNVMLAQGNVRMAWVPAPEENLDYTQSWITQKADEISLGVQNSLSKTGIDITSGKINLNANNTNINGNLNVKDADIGLVLYDSSTPRISILNRNLGNVDSNTGSVGWPSNYTSQSISSGNSYVSYSLTLNLGAFNSGYSVTLSNFSLNNALDKILSANYTEPIIDGISSIQWYCIGAVSYGSSSSKISGGSFESTMNNSTITGTGSQQYIYFYFTVYFISTNHNYNRRLTTEVTCKTSSKTTNAMRIGKDAAIFQSAADKYAWLGGSDRSEIKYGDAKLTIRDGRIERSELLSTVDSSNNIVYSSAYTGDISSVVPTLKCQRWNGITLVGDRQTFVLMQNNSSTSDKYVGLPWPGTQPVGRIIYVKNIDVYSRNCYVRVNTSANNGSWATGRIIERNSANAVDYVNIEYGSTMFINTGDYWVEFSCT